MNGHTVTALRPRTAYQVQNELRDVMAEAVRRAEDRGFAIGEQVGEARARKLTEKAVDTALGLGFLFGIAFGSTAAVIVVDIVVGWPS